MLLLASLLVFLTCAVAHPPEKEHPAYAVVAKDQALHAVELQTDITTTILSNLTDVTKLDFFWRGGEEFLLYWVDGGVLYEGVWSPGGSVSEIREKGRPKEGSRVVDVAVDRAAQHVYWLTKDDTTYSEGSVAILQMAIFQGTAEKTILVNGWQNQRALTIISHGVISFVEDDEDGRTTYHEFYVAGGISICSHDGPIPVGLNVVVIDQQRSPEQFPSRTFWVDKPSQSVVLEPTTAQRRRLVTHPSLADARSLDVLRSRLLWLDSQGRLWTADFSGGEVEPDSKGAPRQVPGITGGRAVRVLHPLRQLPEHPVCRGGRCGTFCLPRRPSGNWSPVTAQCACSDGEHLSPDDPPLCGGPRFRFPGTPKWYRASLIESIRNVCPGRKYIEPDNVWDTLQK